ncbi:MAG: hypothetical protein MJH10_10420 [Epibacterium sp.]|nr:hypothetical protein [Epibacterium sp.]NQX73954.1 hypothetical protein [Epibacterium sp.]
MKTVVHQQGEVLVTKHDALPANMQTKPVETTERGAIVSHSEQGNHHLIEGDINIIERTDNVPTGMRIFYAILEEPTALIQDATGNPHAPVPLDPGIYSFRISREHDHFLQQARRVAD